MTLKIGSLNKTLVFVCFSENKSFETTKLFSSSYNLKTELESLKGM